MVGKPCASCGMLMMSMADHAAKDPRSRYCKYCTGADGMLQSPAERLRRLSAFLVEDEGISEVDAQRKAIVQMRKMPAWKGKI